MVYNYTVAPPVSRLDPIARELVRSWRSQPVRHRTLAARGNNDLVFTGILTRLGTPSDKPPQGADGRRTVIPVELARRTLDQLPGLPVNVDSGLDDHEKRQIVGILDKGWIEGDALKVQGRLFDKNQKDLIDRIRARQHELGMSYELGEAEIVDTNAPIWELTHLTWTGCALLKKAHAAYGATAVSIAAAAR
jgi:hypothetical protein